MLDTAYTMKLFQKIFGSRNERELKKLDPIVAQIGDYSDALEAKTDAQLQDTTGEFKRRLDQGEPIDDLLPEAFALVRETGRRLLGLRHFDVQLKGGMILHQGKIAEMRTGEGKTLMATLPAYLNALSGKGVHVVTVNDYLAKRDAEWMGQIYRFLGLSVGVVVHGLGDLQRQHAYRADITYGQNNEFGFDYLRDNMKMSPDRMAQRPLHYAIIDEVDSILIDEARTPLIISGPAEESVAHYAEVDKVIPRLKRDIDYTVDEKAHSTMLTDSGVERVEKLLGVTNLYDPQHISLNHHVGQALKAHTLYKKDVNYLIEDGGKIVIIDEHTGRKMPGRRWSDGLHQAIEAKEGVKIEQENQTLATVTFQNYFRMYEKLSGMTGTADTEAAEFHQIYKLDVAVIPTNRPLIRDDAPDLIYKSEPGKFKAVIADITESHNRGQPVLVGTISVEKSEVLAQILRKNNIPFNVLNAKNHGREANFVAQAGRKGAITISTNMAGRGTDIVLGGNAEALAQDDLAREIAQESDATKEKAKPTKRRRADKNRGKTSNRNKDKQKTDPVSPDTISTDEAAHEKRYQELLKKRQQQCDAEREEVLAAGGLKIIGTERHESRRIDNQLRGRAGRQGDPGASRFYLSLDDDLLRIFGADRIRGLMEKLGMEEDVPIEHKWVTRSIENAQKKVEGQNFDQRKNVLEYDDVMNQQRKAIYALRKQILEGKYAPTLSEEEIKAGKQPQPPTTSGTWTVESLSTELRPQMEALVNRVLEELAANDPIHNIEPEDEEDEEGIENLSPEFSKPVPWRVLRTEIWRQTGALCDLEKRIDAPRSKLIEYIVTTVAASQIQQRERLLDLADSLLGAHIDTHCPPNAHEEAHNIPALRDALQEQFNIPLEFEDHGLDPQDIAERVWKQLETRIDEREQELSRPFLMYFLRHFYLEEIDQLWIEHLKSMDHLREGIGLRGYGQKDPKKEYKKEGFDLFGQMMHNIQVNVATKMFRVQIKRDEEEVPELRAKNRNMQAVHPSAGGGSSAYGAAADGAAQEKQKTVRRTKPRVGRNAPCPCGSGKKYKKCHGREGAQASA